MRVLRLLSIVPAVLLLAVPLTVRAYNPALEWHTISTEHFDVHYHNGEEWTANQVARIAEQIRPHIVGLYKYDPGRVHFVILDDEDYANGATYYYDNKIEIWATNLEFGLRGTTPWLRNVVTHEYTHMVSIQAAMKMPRRIPAIYFQVIGFEDEKRPDVLTGYPNRIISYPIVGAVIPTWWAEGVAQYQAPDLHNDCWDTHRDMILRAAVTQNKMLSYTAMGYFGHTSLGNEEVYDHGFGLVRYIAATYGPDALDRISRQLGRWDRLTIDGALKKVTGKSGQELYDDWVASLRARYDRELVPVRANPRSGRVLSDAGYWTVEPSFSPDGKTVALLSNKGSDFARTSLYVVDRSGGKLRLIVPGVSSRPAFSPDGTTLLYGKHVRQNLYGSKRSDLFTYDLKTRKEKRLTRGLRAAQAEWSPDGSEIVFLVNGDGTDRIAVAKSDGSGERILYQSGKGTQFYAPQYSPDGSRILFGVFKQGTREVATIASDGTDFRYVLRTNNDERDARWTPDGTGIVFSSDRTGIFNIYTLDLSSGAVRQLTNVAGGAFMPDMAADGSVVYAGYNGDGYHVSLLEPRAEPVATMGPLDYAQRTAGPFDECKGLKRTDTTIDVASHTEAAVAPASSDGGMPSAGAPDAATAAQPADDHPQWTRGKYKRSYTDFQLYPRVVIYDGTPRFGAFLGSNEILDKQSFFAGGSYGTNKEYDGFVTLEFHDMFRMPPVLFMQLYGVREFFDDHIVLDGNGGDDLYYKLGIRYDLWSADLGLRLDLGEPYSITYQNQFSVWYSHSEYKVHIDPYYRPLNDPTARLIPDQPVGWKYFIGNDYYAQWHLKSITPAIDSDINPRGGRQVTLTYMRGQDRLFTSGEFEYGFNPIFDKNNYDEFTLDWYEYLGLPYLDHSLQLRLKAAVIDRKVEDFFWIYMGGLDGIRGYTYYSIGGRRGLLGSVTYRFPIWRRIDKQFLNLTLKDLYGGVFFEAANAWTKTELKDHDYKKSVGGELRLNMGSFYAYPVALDFVAAYPLQAITFKESVFQSDLSAPIVDAQQWRYYLTLGFNF